jgi:membrane protease YdiL (CAAX protease family)
MSSLSARIWAVLWSALLSSLIAVFGSGIWILLIATNLSLTPAIPWSFPLMALVLWLMWQYLGGRWWPKSTSDARRACLRSFPISGSKLIWALIASVLSVIALMGFWIVLVELVGAGGNPTIPDYSRYPHILVILGLLTGSLVSPITEEAAFRGYAQVRLERVFPAAAAVFISSLLFAFWHGPTQGFVWSKLLFYFVVGLAFGATAYFTNSSLSAIPAHILGDVTFFFFIWPHDAVRPLVWRDGANLWFWVYLAQAVIFTILAIIAFRRLRQVTQDTHTDQGFLFKEN